ALRPPADVPALNRRGKPAPLRDPDHVDVVARLEQRNIHAAPDLRNRRRIFRRRAVTVAAGVVEPELAHKPRHRLDARLLRVTLLGFRGVLRLLFAPAQLHSLIAVRSRRRLALQHRARPGLNISDRDELAVLIEYLGHAQLLAYQSE